MKKNIIISILVVIILCLGGYLVFDKVLTNNDSDHQEGINNSNKQEGINNGTEQEVINNGTEQEGINNGTEQEGINNGTEQEVTEIPSKENNINYRLERDSSDSDLVNIYKISNDNKELIANYRKAFKGFGNIGMYNNKLYINKADKIVYFDLEKTNPQEETWIEIPQENARLGGRYLMSEKIINNKLYFITNDNNMNDKYRGILAIDMNATDFSEFKNIYSTDIAKFEYDKNNQYIYFTKSYTDNTAYQFNLSTSEIKQIEHNFQLYF